MKYNKQLISTNIKTGELIEFVSVVDACKKNGFKHAGITTCLNGVFKQHHGHTFKLKES